MASDIWLMTILIVRKETRCRHIGYSYRLTARVLLYAPSHRQDNTYHGLCYASRGALAGTWNSSMGPPHEGSIRRPIAPWANALPLSYVPLPHILKNRNYLGVSIARAYPRRGVCWWNAVSFISLITIFGIRNMMHSVYNTCNYFSFLFLPLPPPSNQKKIKN